MEKKIKNILYIHRTQGIGVESVHINGIVDAFRKQGICVDIFSPVGMTRDHGVDDPKKESSGTEKKKLSLLSKYMPELMFELLEILYNFVAARKLSKYDLSKYDLIFERYAIFSVVGARCARKIGMPLVLEVNYTSQSPLVRKRSALLKPLATYIDKVIFNSASLLTPVSSTLKKELIEQFGVAEEKIVVLPNAADPSKFVPRKNEQKERKKIIGFVGGFYPWHGLDLLIDAFSLIHEKVSEAQVMLIGDGPELENIKQKVRRAGLDEKVVFTGRVSHDVLPEMMSRFYVGVMPNSNEYGSPMKIFEYMALSIPVIAPDYPPIMDVIENGAQGIIFQKSDCTSLKKALEKVLTDDDSHELLSRNARNLIEKTHNWDNNVSKIIGAQFV